MAVAGGIHVRERNAISQSDLILSLGGNGGHSSIVSEAFERYRAIIFKHLRLGGMAGEVVYDVSKISVIVHSDNEELQLGVDEGYTLLVAKNSGLSITAEVTIEASTIYGALRGLEVSMLWQKLMFLVMRSHGVLDILIFGLLFPVKNLWMFQRISPLMWLPGF